MKYRNGFVSNSSTTSFLIYGINCDNIEGKYFVDYYDDDGNEGLEENEINIYDPKVEPLVVNGYDEKYLGRSLTECKDDETMGDFKKRIREEVKAIVGIDIPDDAFKIFEEAWRDG